MVSPLRGFLHTTTYTAVGYIVADEKLNFLPKRVYIGLRECHIEPNWLLVYRKNTSVLILTLMRTGSHSDLF